MFKAIILVSILVFGWFHGSQALVNGCGPNFMGDYGNIILNLVGEGVMVQCCNAHDSCYSQCSSQSVCDNTFDSCLTRACNSLPNIRKQLCQLDASTMVWLVRTYGHKFFCTRRTLYHVIADLQK